MQRIGITKLYLRRLLAPIARMFAPGFGKCYHCGTPWRFVRSHVTMYDDHRGCFCLCRQCWPLLSTAQRLAYYEVCFHDWQRLGCDNQAEDDLIRDRVLAEV